MKVKLKVLWASLQIIPPPRKYQTQIYLYGKIINASFFKVTLNLQKCPNDFFSGSWHTPWWKAIFMWSNNFQCPPEESYGQYTNFALFLQVFLTLPIWPWVKVLTHLQVIKQSKCEVITSNVPPKERYGPDNNQHFENSFSGVFSFDNFFNMIS